jgi:hypothetical protein
MVKCQCGKDITKLPRWLAEVKNVTFVCSDCPNSDTIRRENFTQIKIPEKMVSNVPTSFVGSKNT